MTATTPVERISDILTNAGYRRMSAPLKVADLAFEFPATFIGSGKSADLILVADTAIEAAPRILRKVESIGRALDVLQSKRPVTVVLAGPRPDAEVIDALTRVGRVLPVGTQVDKDLSVALMNWLAVLLPLRLPQPSQSFADPLLSVRTAASDIEEHVRGLIDVAREGADAVQTNLHALLTKTFGDEERSP